MIQNLPPEVIRRMYTRGYLSEKEMCLVAHMIRDHALKREFCKRKRNSNSNRSPRTRKSVSTRRRTPIKAKRPWLK